MADSGNIRPHLLHAGCDDAQQLSDHRPESVEESLEPVNYRASVGVVVNHAAECSETWELPGHAELGGESLRRAR